MRNKEKRRIEVDIRRISQGASGYAGNPWKINRKRDRKKACQLFEKLANIRGEGKSEELLREV